MSIVIAAKIPMKNLIQILCMASIMSFPRSFVELKLFLILLFSLSYIITIYKRKTSSVGVKIIIFYILVMALGLIWSIIGLNNGNPLQAISDSLRLYVAWSIAFIIMFSAIEGEQGRLNVHNSLIVSAVVIFISNLIGVIDSLSSETILSEATRLELEMNIGYHDGYMQIMSNNIGSLFFIVPYFYVYLAQRGKPDNKYHFEKISLILLLIVAVASGRRALWLSLLAVPIIDYVMSNLWGRVNSTVSKKIVLGYILFSPFVILYFISANGIDQMGAVSHVMDAFSKYDERSIQLSYLMIGFYDNFLLGSGFGGYAGYTRNIVAPWMYELTYFQILYNFGVIGTLVISIIFVSYFFMAFKQIGNISKFYPNDKGLFIGVLTLMIGAYSNPYLGSFDFLFIFGFLPYLTQTIGLNSKG